MTEPVITTSMIEHRNPALHAVDGVIISAGHCPVCLASPSGAIVEMSERQVRDVEVAAYVLVRATGLDEATAETVARRTLLRWWATR